VLALTLLNLGVSNAYQVLKDSGRRAEYDKQNGGVYNVPDLEDPNVVFGEEFGENAFGDDSDSEDDEEEEDSGENVKVKPNQAHMAIYNSATPFIQRVLAHPPMTKEEKDVNLKEVKAINHQIKEQNVKDGLEGDNVFQLYIEYTIFESNGIQAKPHIDKLRNNPQDSNAKDWVKYYDSILERAIRTHGYPTSWTLKESALPKGTGRAPKNARNATTAPTSSAQGPTKSAASSQTIVNWQPGLTLAGDMILGVLPRERNVRRMVDGVRGPTEKIVFGYQFITRRETENGPTIALESGEEVGNKATAGYFSLPKENILDLRYSEERYSQEDAELFDKLLDFASNPFQTRSSNSLRFPPGYGLASFKNGTEDVLSRTALRKMLGRTDADYEIQECEKRNGITPAWTVEPLGWREPRSMVVESGKRHNQRLRGRETRPMDTWKRYELRQTQSDSQHDQSETDEGLFVSGQKKSGGRGRRASSRSSRKADRSVSRSSAQALDEVSKVRDDVAQLKAMIEKFILGGK
jgi:hypothetical protein